MAKKRKDINRSNRTDRIYNFFPACGLGRFKPAPWTRMRGRFFTCLLTALVGNSSKNFFLMIISVNARDYGIIIVY